MDQPFETEQITRDIPTEFTVKRYMDHDADTSWLGHYSNRWESGAIDREAAGDYNRNEYQYWIPTPGGSTWDDYQRETHNWYTERGYSKHESGIAAHQHRAADYRRICALERGDWHFLGIVVESPWGESASLWGIESDSDDSHFEEVIDSLIAELVEQKTITIRVR